MSAQVIAPVWLFTIDPLRDEEWLAARSAAGRSLARSLALRPRLATGLPWTIIGLRDEGPVCQYCRPSRSRVRMPQKYQGPTGVRGSCRRAPRASIGGRAGAARRPWRRSRRPRAHGRTITITMPMPIRTSPMLKTLAKGTHGGSAKMSVRGASAGSGTERAVGVGRSGAPPSAAAAAALRRHVAAVRDDRGEVARRARPRPRASR